MHLSSSLDPFLGALVADALAMPVHWYYDRLSLRRDYGRVDHYVAPKNPHADSILWRSKYTPPNARGDILHEQAQYWGRRGVHYHQFLAAGENTLNLLLAVELVEQVRAREGYDADAWLAHYLDFMLTPGRHRDTYVEEYHRAFFTNYARGKKPSKCGVADVHIGGLAPVPALVAALGPDATALREIVQTHVGLTHQDPGVLAAADVFTRVLVRTLAGEALRTVIESEATDWVSASKMSVWALESDEQVIGARLSPACYIKDAFPAALYLAWKYAGDFDAGVIANANVGGDNCHRGVVVGALLAANHGVPERWCQGLLAHARVMGVPASH
jgi:ADP-ribosylglycohydrolase